MPMDDGQDPMMGGGDMPMDNGQDPMMGGGDMPMDNGQDPMMGGDDSEMDGFDAGVEANPEEDPKKYIQQLSGKLSQELRSYNQEQENPDTELNKYVAGMIIPQATKDMTDKDKEEVIGKIKSGTIDEPDDMENSEIDYEEPMDDGDEMNNEMPTENKKRMNSIVTEIMNSFEDSDRKRKEKKLTYKNKNFNPFISKF